MDRNKFNFITSLLYDYPKTDEYIKQRTEELMYPYNHNHDENIGGGRSNITDNPVERMAINIATDRRLTTLERNKKIIDQCLDQCSWETYKIIDTVYFKRAKSVEGVAMEIPLSASQVRRLRQQFFERVADELGI